MSFISLVVAQAEAFTGIVEALQQVDINRNLLGIRAIAIICVIMH